ncbi:hypothetical protein ABWI00_07710 [Algihabitans albus]|uniref:hypothetical protein n=1 Tax=Algihabitans albus TaxID=2164067 RepID=UPI0035CFD518
MPRLAILFGLLLPLTACGMPTPISIASLVLDIGSYAVTGKTSTDHAMSAIAGEDCAVIRVLEGDPCSSPDDYELALAVLEPLPDAGDAVPPVRTADLQSAQVAAYGIDDIAPRGPFLQASFLSDDAAPGVAPRLVSRVAPAVLPTVDTGLTVDTGPSADAGVSRAVAAARAALNGVQLGEAGFLSDDLWPDRGQAARPLGVAMQPLSSVEG